MGEYKKTIRYDEPGDEEILRFKPSWHDDEVATQSIALCPTENTELSIIVHKLWNNGENNFCHLVLTEEEVDMMIKALLKVKDMRSKKVSDSNSSSYKGIFSKLFTDNKLE
jgi:hypothetical protein